MNLADVQRFFDPYRFLLGDEWDSFCEACTRPLYLPRFGLIQQRYP